jgi:thiosulfate dehydrogenase [quinone] large subunit
MAKSHMEAPQKAEMLLRMGLGLLMLIAGVGKIVGGYTGFVEGTSAGFAEGPLPMALVTAFLYAVPVLEVILGVLLILGIRRVCVLFSTGILLLLFIIGLMLKGDIQGVNGVFVYLLVTGFTMTLPGGCCLMGGKK